MIPLFSSTDAGSAQPQVVGAYGRKVNQQLRPGTPKHLPKKNALLTMNLTAVTKD